MIFSLLQYLYYLMCFYYSLFICNFLFIYNLLLWYDFNFKIVNWINEQQLKIFIWNHTLINKFNLLYPIWQCCCNFSDNQQYCDTTGHSNRTNMTWGYFRRMLLLLGLVGYTFASNDTVRCTVCQAPVLQDPHVPWAYLLSNTMHEFSASGFRETHV